jgi:hypothetical protein
MPAINHSLAVRFRRTTPQEVVMLKIFSILSHGRPTVRETNEQPRWLHDPLAHPAIEAMDSRMIGDLPFGLFRAGTQPAAQASAGQLERCA